jgi:hypothetical protein
MVNLLNSLHEKVCFKVMMNFRRNGFQLGYLFFIVIFTLGFSACAKSFYGNSPADLAPSYTAYALTYVFELTPSSTPTIKVPKPTKTPKGGIPTSTNTPEFPPAPTDDPNCYDDAVVENQTISDWTVYKAGKSFRQTWELRNEGSCIWKPDYELVFVKGDSMGSSSAYVNTKVRPGDTVEITIKFIAPTEGGMYTGYFQLTNLKGEKFGEHPEISIEVKVQPTSINTNTTAPTNTKAPTKTPAPTQTRTPTSNFTSTPTRTPTTVPPTATFTNTPTETFTPVPTDTPTPTPTNTP